MRAVVFIDNMKDQFFCICMSQYILVKSVSQPMFGTFVKNQMMSQSDF